MSATIDRRAAPTSMKAAVQGQERLGGMRIYHRRVAFATSLQASLLRECGDESLRSICVLVYRSECPKSRPGSIWSRTRCLSSFASGKPPSCSRDQMGFPSSRISKIPASRPGIRVTPPSSASNVLRSSWAIQAARRSQRHLTQYSISTMGRSMSPLCRAIGGRFRWVDRQNFPVFAHRKRQRR
jgi:hypothetical protein